jgi:ferritin-like metal-binding protein YciE
MTVGSLRDLSIAALQEIHEIAVYGSLATWAKQLWLDEDVQTLLAILEEEKRTDERLSMLAKRMINPDAAAT